MGGGACFLLSFFAGLSGHGSDHTIPSVCREGIVIFLLSPVLNLL